MPPLLVLATMLGLAAAGSACMNSSPILAESPPFVRGGFPDAYGSSLPVELREIDVYRSSA
jgi:hypothetical protein